ncbi:hypothetical protein J6590_023803 [Homalodisca vitripennis]|nr:hypothetical protein J6590_023803 [Homalodisca vitripennis]
MLNRSNTWPLVVVQIENNGRTKTKLDANFNEKAAKPPDSGQQDSGLSVAIDPKKAATLTRHYYLEGDWGWVVVVASVLVHLLHHGLQLSWGVLLEPTARRFTTSITDTGQFQE